MKKTEEKMIPLRKILVGLDATEMDSTLIQFASFLARTYAAENVYFVNIIKDTPLPKAVRKEFPTLMEDAIKDRKRLLEKSVIDNFDMTLPSRVKIAVEQGSFPSKHILKLAEKYSIDAIIVGRKQHLKSNSVVTQRLARRATCSLLIVPERSHAAVCKLMVAIDFSNDSQAAMQEAISVASKCMSEGRKIQIVALHVYQVPSGYHYTGKSYEEFAAVMEDNAKKQYQRFMRKIDTKDIQIKPVFVLENQEDTVATIYEQAVRESVDCIVIGGKGKAASTAFFPIGTNTERLISMDTSIPLLVVRPKHKNAGLIELLQKI